VLLVDLNSAFTGGISSYVLVILVIRFLQVSFWWFTQHIEIKAFDAHRVLVTCTGLR
jgi:DNA polymerase sigma